MTKVMKVSWSKRQLTMKLNNIIKVTSLSLTLWCATITPEARGLDYTTDYCSYALDYAARNPVRAGAIVLGTLVTAYGLSQLSIEAIPLKNTAYDLFNEGYKFCSSLTESASKVRCHNVVTLLSNNYFTPGYTNKYPLQAAKPFMEFLANFTSNSDQLVKSFDLPSI